MNTEILIIAHSPVAIYDFPFRIFSHLYTQVDNNQYCLTVDGSVRQSAKSMKMTMQ